MYLLIAVIENPLIHCDDDDLRPETGGALFVLMINLALRLYEGNQCRLESDDQPRPEASRGKSDDCE